MFKTPDYWIKIIRNNLSKPKYETQRNTKITNERNFGRRNNKG